MLHKELEEPNRRNMNNTFCHRSLKQRETFIVSQSFFSTKHVYKELILFYASSNFRDF